jgi:hypothetical protein
LLAAQREQLSGAEFSEFQELLKRMAHVGETMQFKFTGAHEVQALIANVEDLKVLLFVLLFVLLLLAFVVC